MHSKGAQRNGLYRGTELSVEYRWLDAVTCMPERCWTK